MNSGSAKSNPCKTRGAPDSGPYDTLHIYYLKGCVHRDPLLTGDDFIGNWQEAGDAFLFFKRPAETVVQALIARQPHLTLVDRYCMGYDEWQGGRPGPMQLGDLRVVPPWHESAQSGDPQTLLLDPGVVFGTGTHPTTRDCLAAMQMAFGHREVSRVLDLGTGTGLLALAAVRLGARQCLAVDLNRLAVETTRRNVRLNRMEREILPVQGNARNFMDLACDLMISNIHYDVMRHLVASPGFKVRKQFILSGLLRSQAKEIERQLQQGPCRILEKWSREGVWHTFYGRCG